MRRCWKVVWLKENWKRVISPAPCTSRNWPTVPLRTYQGARLAVILAYCGVCARRCLFDTSQAQDLMCGFWSRATLAQIAEELKGVSESSDFQFPRSRPENVMVLLLSVSASLRILSVGLVYEFKPMAVGPGQRQRHGAVRSCCWCRINRRGSPQRSLFVSIESCWLAVQHVVRGWGLVVSVRECGRSREKGMGRVRG